jgi:hypothetical protein
MEEQIPWNRVLLERSVLFLSGQQIHRILWNTKFHYLFHNRLLLVPILSQITPVYTIRLYIFCFILILLSDLNVGLTSGLFFAKFPHQNTVCICLLSVSCHMPRPLYRPWFGEDWNRGVLQYAVFCVLLLLPC